MTFLVIIIFSLVNITVIYVYVLHNYTLAPLPSLTELYISKFLPAPNWNSPLEKYRQVAERLSGKIRGGGEGLWCALPTLTTGNCTC